MVTLRCSLQKRFPALITDVLGLPSSGCLLTFVSTLHATRMGKQLTNGREKQQRMTTSFLLEYQKGVVKLIMNFCGSAEGKHPSPMDAVRTNAAGHTNSPTAILGHLPGFSDQAERTEACNR